MEKIFLASRLLKSCSRRLRKIKDMEMQMFLKRQNKSRKRFLQEALGLCVVASNRERKERSGDQQKDFSWWRKGYLNWNDKAHALVLNATQLRAYRFYTSRL